MKRVAFLSFDWDYDIMSEYYLGLAEMLRDRDDLQVFIYNSFGHYSSHRPDEGCFRVFELYRPEDYDGLLIQGNRSWPPELRQAIVDKTVALGKPVVSINYELEGAHAVGTDNYREEYELVYRVLRDRKCTKAAFVNGLRTSVEAQARAQGYRDACAELGVTDARFYNANWQLEAGVATAKKLLRKPDDLPEVVFCCNDDLAVGLMETLQSAGVIVPENVMVTGFDNREIAQRAVPRVTTIDRDYRTIAATALITLSRLIDGEELPRVVNSPAKHILTESCGYDPGFDAGKLSSRQMRDASLMRFYEALSDYQASLFGTGSLYGILENCERFVRELDCPNVYVSLNDDYLHEGVIDDSCGYGPTSYLVARKGRSLVLSCNADHVYTSFATPRILPHEVAADRSLYLVNPLRLGDAAIGIFVTEGVPDAVRHGFLSFFLTMLSAGIDAAQKRALLRQAREELAALSSPEA